MENVPHQLAVRLSGHQPDVRRSVSLSTGLTPTAQNLNIHRYTGSVDGHFHSQTAPEILGVDCEIDTFYPCF
jgi:hypothetical protein